MAVDGLRTGRYLDTPELTAFHDKGNGQTIFDRLDYQPGGKDVFHLNLFTARSWFQIPNDYDQLGQDQHERVLTWNIAPGYQHTFSAHTLLTMNPYIRKDQVNYYASRDPFSDTPATQNQSRQLLNWGVKADVSTTRGHNNIKYGIDLKQTRLLENFGFAITDPGFNSPCADNARDREEMDALGANGYFRKPSEFSEFMALGQIVRDLLKCKKRSPAID